MNVYVPKSIEGQWCTLSVTDTDQIKIHHIQPYFTAGLPSIRTGMSILFPNNKSSLTEAIVTQRQANSGCLECHITQLDIWVLLWTTNQTNLISYICVSPLLTQSPSRWWWEETDSSTPAMSIRSCAASASTTPWLRVSEASLSISSLIHCMHYFIKSTQWKTITQFVYNKKQLE